MAYTVELPSNYASELRDVNYKLSSYPKYVNVVTELKKHNISEGIIAGFIGCMCPESGCEHDRINNHEYSGLSSNSGTHGWNCGEGLVQWTYWDSKEKLIQKYNSDSRKIHTLPTTWSEYSQGKPVQRNGKTYAEQDNKHIAGLSLSDQIIFLLIYYDSIIKSLANETNLAVITAKIYQKKAGQGFFEEETNPIVQAYKTAGRHYTQGEKKANTYLRSLSVAQQYLNNPPVTTTTAVSGTTYGNSYVSAGGGSYIDRPTNISVATNITGVSNNVVNLSLAANYYDKNLLQQSANRKREFEALRDSMAGDASKMGMDIYLPEEIYDTNILKGSRKSKTTST